jgi:O-acetylserine/cysteine efflux transporter
VTTPRAPGPLFLATCVALLFVIWSHSFIAIGYVLGGDAAPARLDAAGLTVARFVPAALACLAYGLAFRARECVGALRADGPRLLLCGALAVPAYNLALYTGQQRGVPAPIAALTTALLPLFVMLLAAAFLDERLTGRRLAGFAVASAGMAIVAMSRRGQGGGGYALAVAVTALAPLSWSLFSVLSKGPSRRVSPLLWTYLAVILGTLLLAPLFPRAWPQIARLDAAGWAAVLYLSFPCTVLGFALWTWLLRHLPASSVGFTVFLNPPLATVSKAVLAVVAPSTFVLNVTAPEFAGGGLALAGLLLAVTGAPRYPPPVIDVTVQPLDRSRREDFLAVMGAGSEESRACLCTAYHGVSPETPGAPAACRERLLSEGPSDGWLLYVGGRPAGWVQCAPWESFAVFKAKPAPEAGAWVVTCLVVVPELRKRGFAHELFRRALDEAFRRGAAAVVACGHRLGPGYSSPLPELPESVCVAAGLTLLRDDRECPMYIARRPQAS